MIYISPIQEKKIGGAFTDQVNQWVAYLSDHEDPNQMKGGLTGDVSSVQKSWIPGKKLVEGQWQDRQGGPNLTSGFRAKQRMVIGHNCDRQIAVYAKFTLGDYVKLDYVATKPSPPLVNCGAGVKPLRSMLAFLAAVGIELQKPVKLEADGRDQDRLVRIYQESGWELTGERGAGPEMELSVVNLQRPLSTHKEQQRGTHWEFGGENTLADYIRNGAQ